MSSLVSNAQSLFGKKIGIFIKKHLNCKFFFAFLISFYNFEIPSVMGQHRADTVNTVDMVYTVDMWTLGMRGTTL